MNPLVPLGPYETRPNHLAAARLVIPQFLGGRVFLLATLRSELRASILCLVIRNGLLAVSWFKDGLDWRVTTSSIGDTVIPQPWPGGPPAVPLHPRRLVIR
ncbi:hypothetical protein Dcar01_01200 [Deinococcus carri]|uniref:Uncharacterized protein n=1 Tax=Deinococcus carri TaxID=1211323 RepID=A0ABP9W5Z3_9DEIO